MSKATRPAANRNPLANTPAAIPAENSLGGSTEQPKDILEGSTVLPTVNEETKPVSIAGKAVSPNHEGKVYLEDTRTGRIIAGPIDIAQAQKQVRDFKHIKMTTNGKK